MVLMSPARTPGRRPEEAPTQLLRVAPGNRAPGCGLCLWVLQGLSRSRTRPSGPSRDSHPSPSLNHRVNRGPRRRPCLPNSRPQRWTLRSHSGGTQEEGRAAEGLCPLLIREVSWAPNRGGRVSRPDCSPALCPQGRPPEAGPPKFCHHLNRKTGKLSWSASDSLTQSGGLSPRRSRLA